jgi:anti-sigma regulatory factor (Ser/Thr protein kinase)
MNDEIQLVRFREAFYRRERRTVPAAREFAAQALSDWGVTDRREDVLLCVSELATNALLHGVPPGRGYRVHLFLEPDDLLRLEVHDSGPGLSRVRVAKPGPEGEAEHGRGLMLISALADAWGVAERDPGKIVWCAFAVRRTESGGAVLDDTAPEPSPSVIGNPG